LLVDAEYSEIDDRYKMELYSIFERAAKNEQEFGGRQKLKAYNFEQGE
jgi:hypothetical protein